MGVAAFPETTVDHRGPHVMPHLRFAPWLASVAVAGSLAACGQGDSGPPESAEGAAGVVASGNAAASQDPAATGALSGGPSGQTPAFGEAGGAPSVVTSPGDGAPPSVGSENSPSGGESRGADADSQVIPK
jgi:hypothetical protein